MRLSICCPKRRIDNSVMPVCFFKKYYYRDVLLVVESCDNTAGFNFQKFCNFFSRSSSPCRATRRGLSRRAKISRTKVCIADEISFAVVIPAHFPDALPASARIVICTVRKTRQRRPRVFPYPHLGISVLSVVLLPRNGEKTTCTRENWRNGRQRIFIPSRSYANLDRSSS